jgi:hypothetical protein
VSTPEELAKEVAGHAVAFERSDAVRSLASLDESLKNGGEPLAERTGRILMQALLNVRWFDLAASAGYTLARTGTTSTGLTRRHAQALIEEGRLAEAETVIDQALASEQGPERAELLGLKGRVDKQRYFDRLRREGASDIAVLRKAAEAYRSGYELDRERNGWHGVNLVACLMYAKRHGLAVTVADDPVVVAREVLDNLDAKLSGDAWDFATRAEASLAVGDVESAILAMRRYAEHDSVSAFHLGSTFRQLEQVWELGDGHDPAAADLLLLLRARLSDIEKGSVRLAPQDVDRLQGNQAFKRLEAVFGAARFTSLDWFKTALDRCASVAKIGTETRAGIGTGWVVRGGDLAPSLGDEVVLVTNAHVVAKDDAKAVSPDEAVVRFQANETVARDTTLEVKPEILFWSPPDELDAAVLRFASPPAGVKPLRIAKQMPVVEDGSRVLIIGHPEGGDLSLSINDNDLLDRDDRYLHYRAPTEGGSSGSPVFNRDWRVIGLHHAGGDAIRRLNNKEGTYQANEGIRIDVIAAAVTAKLA